LAFAKRSARLVGLKLAKRRRSWMVLARAREVDSGDSHWTAALRPLCFSLER